MTCCPKIESDILIQEEESSSEEQFYINKELKSKERLDICLSCPEIRTLNRCNQCGCFMNIKTRIYNSKCPLGKW